MPRAPRTPSAATYVNDDAAYTPGVVEAVQAYAASKPWRGSRDQQHEKLAALHAQLCECCEIDCRLIESIAAAHYTSAVSVYHRPTNAIYTAGRLTVVGYLYAFAGALCGEEHGLRMTFAVNLYKRCFPRSFAAADLSGMTVVVRRTR